LGGDDDQHAVHMLEHLRRVADAELLDSRWFPARLGIAYDPASGAGWLRLPGGRTVDLAAVRSVYWRVYNGVGTAELPNAGQSFVAANDARSLFEGLLMRLPVRWVN